MAAIDCGTNSIRLLIADIDGEAGRLVDVDRIMEIVRLGEGIDRTHRISEAALTRTFDACDRYAALIASRDVARVRFVATSASRDAENRDEFVDGVLARIGVRPEVVTGNEEAALSFVGATSGLGSADLAAQVLVVDIGGGSTEFVLGQPGGSRPAVIEAAVSVDMGCVRLTERHLHGDPPTAEQLAAARADVGALIAEAGRVVPLDRGATLVGLAGSVTTVAAMALELPAYDSERIHGSRIGADAVHIATERLLRMTHAERAALGYMHPGRVDVIGGGALVLDEIMRSTNASEVLVSEHDILDGIAWSAVGLGG